MRVVTNTADARSVVSPRMRTNTEILKKKQQAFSNNIKDLPSHHIQSLELFLPSAGVTLRQAIMGINISAKQPQSLFISVDADSWGRVIFTFHKKHMTEAVNIIPVIPVYLAHHYGARSWSWFTTEARDDIQDYYYDEPTGEIKSNEDQYVQDIVDETRWEDMEQDANQAKLDFSLSKWVVDVANIATGYQYGDNGTVKSGTSTITGMATDPTIDTDDTPGGISTLTGDSERDKVIQLLQNTSETTITEMLVFLEQRSAQSVNADEGTPAKTGDKSEDHGSTSPSQQ